MGEVVVGGIAVVVSAERESFHPRARLVHFRFDFEEAGEVRVFDELVDRVL